MPTKHIAKHLEYMGVRRAVLESDLEVLRAKLKRSKSGTRVAKFQAIIREWREELRYVNAVIAKLKS